MKNIRLKLVTIISSISIFTLLATAIIVGITSYNIISSENNSKLFNLSEKNVNEINGWLEVQGQIVQEIADSISNQTILDKGQLLKYLEEKTKANSNTSDVYMGFTDKSFIDGSDWLPAADYDCTTRGWYKNAIDKGSLNYGSPSYDLATKKMVAAISATVKFNGQVIGVVAMDVKLDIMNDIVQNTVSKQDGYAFLLDNQDNVMIHANTDYLPTDKKTYTLSDIIKIGSAAIIKENSANKVLKVKDYDGVGRHFIVSEIKATGWKLGISINDSEYMRPVENLITVLIICSVLAALLTVITAFVIGGKIAVPIIALTHLIKKQADFDFRFDETLTAHKHVKRKDEIGVMIYAATDMEENVRKLLSSTADAANQVAVTAGELSATSKQSSMVAQEVAQTVNDIAKGASDQAENTEESMNNLIGLGKHLDENRMNLEKLTEASETVSALVDQGLTTVKSMTEKTRANSVAAKVVFDSIQKTNESSHKISEASRLISSIAEQTNLLSLNAAIEAARAGEQGKGFAVVADEIRKLAEQSAESTKEIDSVVSALLEDAEAAVRKIEETGEIVTAQEESVRLTQEQFNQIAVAMDDAKNALNVINESSNQIEIMKDSIFEAVQSLSAIAEENAASTEQASAAMQEETATIEEISSASEGLMKITTQLQQLVSKFKV